MCGGGEGFFLRNWFEKLLHVREKVNVCVCVFSILRKIKIKRQGSKKKKKTRKR